MPPTARLPSCASFATVGGVRAWAASVCEEDEEASHPLARKQLSFHLHLDQRAHVCGRGRADAPVPPGPPC